MEDPEKMKKQIAFAAAALIATLGPALAGETPSAPGAKVYFIKLKDGAPEIEEPGKSIARVDGGTEKGLASGGP